MGKEDELLRLLEGLERENVYYTYDFNIARAIKIYNSI